MPPILGAGRDPVGGGFALRFPGRKKPSIMRCGYLCVLTAALLSSGCVDAYSPVPEGVTPPPTREPLPACKAYHLVNEQGRKACRCSVHERSVMHLPRAPDTADVQWRMTPSAYAPCERLSVTSNHPLGLQYRTPASPPRAPRHRDLHQHARAVDFRTDAFHPHPRGFKHAFRRGDLIDEQETRASRHRISVDLPKTIACTQGAPNA